MNKLIYTTIAGLTAFTLLSGCQKEDVETKKQLAQLQAQLDAEKAEKAQKEAKEREQKQQEEQQAREEQIRQEAEESVKAQMKMEAEAKAAEQKAAKAKQQAAAKPKFTQKIANYPALVVTQSGYGELSLRGEPSNTGLKVGGVYHGDEVTVRARTNKCEVIGNIDGCWVKVQIKDIQGYMFDGYLQREVLSQEEKANATGRGNNAATEEEDGI